MHYFDTACSKAYWIVTRSSFFSAICTCSGLRLQWHCWVNISDENLSYNKERQGKTTAGSCKLMLCWSVSLSTHTLAYTHTHTHTHTHTPLRPFLHDVPFCWGVKLTSYFCLYSSTFYFYTFVPSCFEILVIMLFQLCIIFFLPWNTKWNVFQQIGW